jgi:hypothetical protein
VASQQALLGENVQRFIANSDWKSALAELEKHFAQDPDLPIRVRMGDAYQKQDQKFEAPREYVYAADLYAEKGAVVKDLAQYRLALRSDPHCSTPESATSSSSFPRCSSKALSTPGSASRGSIIRSQLTVLPCDCS